MKRLIGICLLALALAGCPTHRGAQRSTAHSPTAADRKVAVRLVDRSYSIVTGRVEAVRTGVQRAPCDPPPLVGRSVDPNCGKQTWVLATVMVQTQIKGHITSPVRVFDFTYAAFGAAADKAWARVGEELFLVLRPAYPALGLPPYMTPDLRFEIESDGKLVNTMPVGWRYFSDMTIDAFRSIAGTERERILSLGDPNYRPSGPYGPLEELSTRFVCIGYAGGPIPPTPVNTCFRANAKLHVGQGVTKGAFVEVHLDAARRALTVELYRGRRVI